jgi:hypothetical protein
MRAVQVPQVVLVLRKGALTWKRIPRKAKMHVIVDIRRLVLYLFIVSFSTFFTTASSLVSRSLYLL